MDASGEGNIIWRIQTFSQRGPIKYVSKYLAFISSLEGARVYSQTGWRGLDRIFPQDPPLAQGCTTGSGPESILSGPRSMLKTSLYKKLLVNDGDLWMNVNFIELLTILQLITFKNCSYVLARFHNIKPQARNKLSQFNKFSFRSLILDFRKFSS